MAMFDVKSLFGNIGGAATDLFSAQGDFLEAKNYGMASQLATENAQFTKMSTAVKQVQANRTIEQAIGGQVSDVAGAGFEMSGSAGDLMRDSAAQGSLTKSMLGYQGLITEKGYKEQASAYANMAKAAKTGAIGNIFGAVLKGVGAIFGI